MRLRRWTCLPKKSTEMTKGCLEDKYCFFWNTSILMYYFLFYLIAFYNIIYLIVDKYMDKKWLDCQSQRIMVSGGSYSYLEFSNKCSTTWVYPGICLISTLSMVWKVMEWVHAHQFCSWHETESVWGGNNSWYLWGEGCHPGGPRQTGGMDQQELYGILQGQMPNAALGKE